LLAVAVVVLTVEAAAVQADICVVFPVKILAEEIQHNLRQHL
jgi:hypothetical protein